MSNENRDHLLRRAREAGITDPRELANFMAQMQVESGGFGRMSESLHYSGKRLLQVFPGRNGLDNLDEANRIVSGGPESVANAVYGGAWGRRNLGNILPGDGWTYHGRGYVQLTGRANYARVGRELDIDLVNHPELAGDREMATRIAIHYWKTRVVPNGHQHDVREATRDINGGYNHLAERRAAVETWQQRLQHARPVADEPSRDDIHTDVGVRHLQRELTRLGYQDARGQALRIDGDFGERTREAVQAFQRAHDLDPIGVVGPRTRAALRAAGSQLTPVDPAHPGHALYRQGIAAVQGLDAGRGLPGEGHTERLGASVARLARDRGLERIDHVVLGNGNLFVVQGGLDDPARRVAHMPLHAALATPLAESFRELAREARTPAASDAGIPLVPQDPFEHQQGLRRVPGP